MKPKYNLFKNTNYAIDGLKDIIKNEQSFQMQIISFTIFSILAFNLNLEVHCQLILFFSLFLNLFAEIINSAIERTVDLCTEDFHPLAKQAKDLGATIVFFSFIFTFSVWIAVLTLCYF
jgi:diacylglycerol kinase (ATP)